MKLFISYRRSDSTHAALRVRACLEAKFGPGAVLIDRDIPAGEEWSRQLDEMLQECSGVIVLIGDAFLRELRKRRPDSDPDQLAREIQSALTLKKKIYPVLIGVIDMPEAAKLPPAICHFADYQAVFAREPAFDAAMAVLMKSIADQHGWIEPPAAAAQGESAKAAASWQGLAMLAISLAALGALWLAGRLIAWLAEPAAPAAMGAFEPALWQGTSYALATLLWGLGPYLAFRAVADVRARARLPVINAHGLITVVNVALTLMAGGTFLLLSTRSGWALRLIGVLPESPQPWHYALQGVLLLLIVFTALAGAMLEPVVRRLHGRHRTLGMAGLNAGALGVLLALLWFAASIARSLPPLRGLDPVPLIGYVMLAPALSLLVGAWDYARLQLGLSGVDWRSRLLFWLAASLYLFCTLAYYAHGLAGMLAAGA